LPNSIRSGDVSPQQRQHHCHHLNHRAMLFLA
jgi:hypothetical protein